MAQIRIFSIYPLISDWLVLTATTEKMLPKGSGTCAGIVFHVGKRAQYSYVEAIIQNWQHCVIMIFNVILFLM